MNSIVPAPGMDEATREAICAAAVRAAKAVDYVGAGTIEFIADASEGLRADRIWFMEMNTRLQVEHPVTEEITGQDLVEWQLRVASGEALPKRQEELAIDGWAIEARLYAENPLTGFLPSTGRLERFRLTNRIRSTRWRDPVREVEFENDYPGTGRIETGVEEGGEVSSFYDPMIAKIICHAGARREAALGLAHLVGDAQVWPIRTNATFLHALLVDPDFRRGDVHTGFIDDHHDDVVYEMTPERWLLDPAAEQLVSNEKNRIATGFRLNAPRQTKVRMMDRGTVYTGNTRNRLGFDQRVYPLRELSENGVFTTTLGTTWRFEVPATRGNAAGAAGDGAILSPMPGRIIAVDVAAGDIVTRGQRLVTLEAMMMEHSLTAPFDGVVAKLNAEAGGQVSEGTVLVKIEKAE
jgi:3-methylcrotonyl-CoA carboxylase alpha subunit